MSAGDKALPCFDCEVDTVGPDAVEALVNEGVEFGLCEAHAALALTENAEPDDSADPAEEE